MPNNPGMDTKHPDSKIIDDLGGTAKVARLCDIKPPSVSDWRKSGIPKPWLMYLKKIRPAVFKAAAEREKAKPTPQPEQVS